MKFASRYLIAAALAAAPVAASAQTTPPPAGQREQVREGRGELRGPRPGQAGPGPSPVQGLLRQREQLGLTAQQVSRLEAIDRDLQARNAPLHQQLTALMPRRGEQGQDGARPRGPRGERPEGARPQGERRARPDSAARAQRRAERPQLTDAQRQQMRQRREQAQPIVQQLRANTEQALTQARAVLTAEQQQKVQQRMDERRARQGDRPRRGERPAGAGARSR